MAPRIKPEVLHIKDIAQADQVLGEIAGIQRELKLIETAMNEEMDQVKAQADAKAEPLRQRLKSLSDGLGAFGEFNKDGLFKNRRSLDLVFGTIGFRKSTALALKSKWTLAMVLGKLKELGFKEAIRVKEDPDKDKMAEWPSERLELVGMQRVEKDLFWFEIKEETLKDVA